MDLSIQLMQLSKGLFSEDVLKSDQLLKDALMKMEERWNELPGEKFTSQERAIPATLMINQYIKLKEFNNAYKWADILLSDRKNDLSDVGFTMGRIDFESGNYDSALTNFRVAFHDSKGRVFNGKDPKYLDFIMHPEKYTDVVKK